MWRPVKTRLWIFGTIAALLFLAACLKSRKPGLPPKVVQVLQLTGHNKVELIKALSQYVESSDTAKRNAIYFLISQMEKQYAAYYEITDSAGNPLPFQPLAYPDYKSMMAAWDSLAESPQGLKFNPKRYTLDRDTIKAQLLQNTVELAFESRKLPWAINIPDSIFLRYVLPYRVATEDLEDWRPMLNAYFLRQIDLNDTLKADEVAEKVNNIVNQEFVHNNLLLKMPNISLPSKIMAQKQGSARDMAFFRVAALRSIGIPATLDYIPWISDSLHTIWFTSYYGADGQWKPLLQDPSLLAIIKDSTRVAKVYRHIYHTLDSSLFALKDIQKTTPQYIGHYHYLDVTNQYVPTRNVNYHGPCPDSLIYLAVFNGRHWKAVDWSLCQNQTAFYKHVGSKVNYDFVWVDKHGKTHLIIHNTAND